VVETFTRQIEAGLPLTVTHPEARRYFMTVDEACELILLAAAVGRPGEKLDEDLFGAAEPRDVRPAHPRISHVPVPPTHPDELAGVPVRGGPDQVVAALRALCRPGK
jgi:FlaA1/EpsC-like NDP-sugar epimerase